jgi:hypothetical protein
MDRSDLYPHEAGFPPAISDVSDATSTATDVRLVADARGWDRLPALGHLARLWCFRINGERLAVITQCRSLRRLYLDGLRVSLHTVDRLTDLQVLSVDSATRMESLAEVPASLPLEGLSVTNAPNVTNLVPLRDRYQLRALNVSGGIWSKMTVDSLGPLAGLRELKYLDLMNLKVLDGSLEPLGSLTELTELGLSNFYSVREFARLAARLRGTHCLWFSPTVDLPNVACQKCGKESMASLTGKGIRTMCRVCDADRIRKHEDLFRESAA